MEVTLDSSVLVSALVPKDQYNVQARKILNLHFNGEYRSVSSAIVSVEVTCSIARQVGEARARIGRAQLRRWEELRLMRFEPVTSERAERALELGIRLKLKGMDALVVEIAQEGDRSLITFDQEMARRAAREVKVLSTKDFSP